MIGINKGPIVLDLETVMSRLQVSELAREVGVGGSIAVIVQNPISNADGLGNNTDIMVGDRTQQIYQMLPGQESPLFYVERLENLMIRKRLAADPDVFVNLIIYRKRNNNYQ